MDGRPTPRSSPTKQTKNPPRRENSVKGGAKPVRSPSARHNEGDKLFCETRHNGKGPISQDSRRQSLHLDDRHSPTQRSDPRATQADAPRAVSLTEKDRISLPMLSANSRQQSGIKPEAPHGLPNSQRSSPDRPPVAGTRSSMSRPRPLQEEIDQLEHDLVELERRLEKKDKQLQQLASEVIRSKGDRLHVIPDQQLRLMWDDVDWKLKDWALTYSPNFWKPSFALREWSAAVLSGSRKDYTSERLARVFCGDSKEFQRCVTHNGARRRLVRSFVWDSLRSKIFENRMAYLGANIANSFHNIQEQVRANHDYQSSPKQFHTWRATTVRNLAPGRRTRERSEWVVQVADEILMSLRLSKNAPKAAQCCDELRSIIHAMIDLDVELLQQRALYDVRPLWSPAWYKAIGPWHRTPARTGFPFHSTYMDDDSARNVEATSVAVVLTPALVKRGTQDGEKYDEEEVVFCKAQVVNARDWGEVLRESEREDQAPEKMKGKGKGQVLKK